jgi:hypothetical protein
MTKLYLRPAHVDNPPIINWDNPPTSLVNSCSCNTINILIIQMNQHPPHPHFLNITLSTEVLQMKELCE